MEIAFKRRLTNELLTTYLLTFLLLGITTTFFKSFFFEASLTVNLTDMLVIPNLFIRQVESKIIAKPKAWQRSKPKPGRLVL